MNVACTKCSHRFDGAGYRDMLCPLCGAIAQARPCPRCSLPLVPRHVHDAVLDVCERCQGLFVDHIVTRLLADHDPARERALAEQLPMPTGTERPPGGNEKPLCPVCGIVMQQRLSDSGAGIVIEICRSHGTFFDGGELDKLVAFAQRDA